MLVELRLASEAALPRDIEVEYVGQTSEGVDAAIIPNVWSAAETLDDGVRLEMETGETHHIPNAELLKSGGAPDALNIPGSELREIGELNEGTNQWRGLVALADCLAATEQDYATPEEVAEYTALDLAATRQALSTLFALKDALIRRPADYGRGGIKFQFGLTQQASHLVTQRVDPSDSPS